MSYATRADTYREMEVLSASPGQLLVMLYDHLLVTLRRARLAMQPRNAEVCSSQLQRARDVVAELISTLDLDAGGEVARSLSSLYAYFFGEMMDLAAHPDAERLDRLMGMVTELREAFAQAAGLEAAAWTS